MADRRLQVFHAVARHLSFTKAAESLFMTQPAVTFQVKQLEEHFSTRLFERGSGRIALTAAGEIVFEYASKILGLSAELDVRLGEMTGQVGGPLLIGASTTSAEFMLPRLVGEFKAMHREVRPRIVVGTCQAVESRLMEHTLDIGLIEWPTHLASLNYEVCCEDELRVICAPDFSLAKLDEVAPQQLLPLPFVGREQGSGTRELTDNYFQANGIAPGSLNLMIEMNSPAGIKGVVATGLGYAIVSKAAVEKEQRLGELVVIPLNPRLDRVLSLVYPREQFRSRLVNAFVEFTKRRLQELAAGNA